VLSRQIARFVETNPGVRGGSSVLPTTRRGQILAAAVVATSPVALIVLAFQRRIVQGLTAGAVKG
jgi:ABC-type glycerol-3-phosphate transport system permease component